MEDLYKYIANDVGKRLDSSNYEADRPLAIGKNIKVIELINNELEGKSMTDFMALRLI